MIIVNRRVLLLALGTAATASHAWTTLTLPRFARPAVVATATRRVSRSSGPCFMTQDSKEEEEEKSATVGDDLKFESEEQKKQVVGNLVADDEWDGLTMELTDLVRKSCT